MNENNKQQIIDNTIRYVRGKLEGEGSGHDWWHVYRVYKSAKAIAANEKADEFIVSLGALLHDIADFKFHNGDMEVGPRVAKEWLESLHVDEEIITHIEYIIRNVSFKGAKVKMTMDTIEGKIVQDADRLDAIGAIGIARTFAYGGFKNREIYNPDVKPQIHETFEQYKSGSGHSINHFYEKLLLLKDMMNTETGRKMAEERHKFMEIYLKEFYDEWDGRK
ncbi:MAG: HD domain-containing protein [Bacillota bacterium]